LRNYFNKTCSSICDLQLWLKFQNQKIDGFEVFGDLKGLSETKSSVLVSGFKTVLG
jgi:hypothetical protein